MARCDSSFAASSLALRDAKKVQLFSRAYGTGLLCRDLPHC